MDNSASLTIYICLSVVLVLVGALVAQLARLSPIANLGRYRIGARVIKVLILGILSFLIVFGLIVQLRAEAEYFLSWCSVDNYGKGRLQVNRRAVLRELWVRRLAPPLLSRAYYTSDNYICIVADAVSATSGLDTIPWAWEPIMGFVSALLTVAVAWNGIRYRWLDVA
jgi:hypothetical protein